jgi:DNA-binding MarR family transcriptional regulator
MSSSKKTQSSVASVSQRGPVDPLANLQTMPSVNVDALIVAFHEAFRGIVQEADQLLSTQRLGRSHHKVLFYVARYPNCRTVDVQAFVGVSRQALQRPIADLHRLGLLETLVSPENRRTHLLRLSGPGEVLERESTELIQRHFREVFSNLSPNKVSGWLGITRALADSARG